MAEPSAPTNHEAPPAYFPGDFKSPPPQQGFGPPLTPHNYQPPPQGYPPPPQGYPPPPQGYPPPPQGYPPPQQNQPLMTGYVAGPPQYQSTATVVVVQQPAVSFKDTPVLVTDSNGQQVLTRVEYRAGMLTWLICCVVCWFTGLWCIALIPFCIDETKDVYHFSPTDNKLVGVYKRL